MQINTLNQMFANQLAADLPIAVNATANDIEITRKDDNLLFFTVKGEAWSATLTRTGRVKKNSAKAHC